MIYTAFLFIHPLKLQNYGKTSKNTYAHSEKV